MNDSKLTTRVVQALLSTKKGLEIVLVTTRKEGGGGVWEKQRQFTKWMDSSVSKISASNQTCRVVRQRLIV